VWRDRQLGNASISGPGADTWSKLTEAWPQPQTFTQQYRSLFALWNVKDQIKTDLDLVIPQSGYEVDGITTWVITQFLPFWHNVRSFLQHRTTQTRRDYRPLLRKRSEQLNPH